MLVGVCVGVVSSINLMFGIIWNFVRVQEIVMSTQILLSNEGFKNYGQQQFYSIVIIFWGQLIKFDKFNYQTTLTHSIIVIVYIYIFVNINTFVHLYIEKKK